MIRNNPENLIEFCREYFEEQKKLHPSNKNTFEPPVGAKNSDAANYEELGK